MLVDASHPDQWAYAPAEFRATAQPSAAMGLAFRGAQRLGVARMTNMFPVPTDCGHPAPYCADEKAYRDARFMDAYVAEMGAPQTRCPGERNAWSGQPAARRNNGQHLLLDSSRHGTLQTAYAANISEAILRVVDAVRRGSPMADTKRKAVIE